MARHVVFFALVVGGEAAAVSPIEKVLQMMNDLVSKQMKEKNAEAKTFDKFKTWCHETKREKGFDIDDGNKAIGELMADVEKYSSDANTFGEEVKVLDQEIDQAEAQSASANDERGTKRTNFEKTHADYVASLDSLSSGLKRLKKMMSGTSGAASASLFQGTVQGIAERPELPAFAQAALASFLSEGSEGPGDFQQPEAAAFESSSGGVVGMMEDLHDKMKDEKIDLEKRELNEQNAFNMLAADLKHQMKSNKASRNSKASSMKESEGKAALAKGDLAEGIRVKKEDEKYVKDLGALCHQKEVAFQARQKTREEELEAINNAMEIIGSGDVAGAGSKHLPGLVQRKATGLAQLRSSTKARQPSDAQTAAALFMTDQASKLGSSQLSLLASRVGAEPFVKIRAMIEGMISKLQDEASEEADHKGWCDEELGTNEKTRTAKSTRVAELKASVEEMTAASQKLATDIGNLEKEVADLDAALADATTQREAEKEKNTETLADAKKAIVAVQKAQDVLKEFYTKAAGATALVQTAVRGPADEAPETFDEPFQGNSGGNGGGGILSMMEIILSDFERLEAETDTGEAVAAEEHKKFLADSKADREYKEKERKANGSRMSKTNHDIRLIKKDLQSTQEELAAAMRYFDELKPSCIDSGVSYEERVAARKSEIESLQDALKMLEEGTPE